MEQQTDSVNTNHAKYAYSLVKAFLERNTEIDHWESSTPSNQYKWRSKKISKSLEKSALIMEVNGSLKDLSYEIKKDSEVEIITKDSKAGIEILRHDAAHIMAEAVKSLYSNVQVTIGLSLIHI